MPVEKSVATGAAPMPSTLSKATLMATGRVSSLLPGPFLIPADLARMATPRVTMAAPAGRIMTRIVAGGGLRSARMLPVARRKGQAIRIAFPGRDGRGTEGKAGIVSFDTVRLQGGAGVAPRCPA